MAWTNPHTWATSELVTAALLNTELRDNLNALVTLVPTSTIVPYAGSSLPTNPAPLSWLLCDGSAVSRTTYAALFAAIGTTYGVGDGSTTFNVPDLRGRFPLGKDNMGGTSANRVVATQADNLGQGAGEENHTLTAAEMPVHTHSYRKINFTGTTLGTGGTGSSADDAAQTGSAGSGSAHNTMPPYITLNYIIKA
ncbi:MAG: tail fiber protein [Chloroflexota bacterium]